MTLPNWDMASQKHYQALFKLDEDVFSYPMLEYRCGATKLHGDQSAIVSVDASYDTPHGPCLPWQPGRLPFTDFQFDTALSTFAFFEGDTEIALVLEELRELTRVAKVVYLAPHQLDQAEVSQRLGPLMLLLQQADVGVEITPIEQQAGFEKAVRIKLWAQTCQRR